MNFHLSIFGVRVAVFYMVPFIRLRQLPSISNLLSFRKIYHESVNILWEADHVTFVI